MMTMTGSINASLRGVPYLITEADGQVIFKDDSGFAYCHTNFTMEWTGLAWHLVDFDASSDRVFLPHLVAAAEWLEANYEEDWHEGRATVTYRPAPALERPEVNPLEVRRAVFLMHNPSPSWFASMRFVLLSYWKDRSWKQCRRFLLELSGRRFVWGAFFGLRNVRVIWSGGGC